MKTNNHSEIGWHMILGAIVFLMLGSHRVRSVQLLQDSAGRI